MVIRAYDESVRNKTGYDIEHRILLKDGGIKFVNERCITEYDEAGRPARSMGTVLDITRQRLAEAELKQSEEFNRSIIDTVDEGFIVIDREYRIITANRAFAESTALSVEKLIGKHCYETSHHYCHAPCYDAANACAVTQVFQTGEPYTVIHSQQDDKGKPVYVETKAYPLSKDDSGNVITAIEILIDITEQRNLEAQLRHSQKMEAIGTLAGGVAHDFNNILNVILGYSTMVRDRLRNDPLMEEQMNEVLAAADRASTLTKRLLAFSRRDAANMRPVNINEFFVSLGKMISRIIGEDIALSWELSDEDMIVKADPAQIEQVVMNLVSNARDAMPKGGILTIGSETTEMEEDFVAAHGYGKEGRYVRIIVTDTGIGMDAEMQKKIFEPFFTTKGVGEGTGLGLAIAYGIIKQHEGFINVYSEKGKGTTFKILLPVIRREGLAGQEVEERTETKGGTETILVAEDEPSLMKLKKIVLESFGYTVVTAKDGEDAIAKYRDNETKVHLVILDMIMPKKSGREAYEEIKKITPDVKALFVSGYTMDMIKKKELLEEGMNFILKPISPKDLLRKVRDVLDA